MRSARTHQLFVALSALLLASLACSMLSNPATAPAAPTTAPAATDVPSQMLEPTQQPEPTQTPEPTSIPTPEVGTLILEEKFADNSNNWWTGKDNDTETSVEDGKFKVCVLSQGNYFWFDGPIAASDVDLTADIEFSEGAPKNSGAGFLCHYKDANNHYRISISADGYYAIQKWVDDESFMLAGLVTLMSNWPFSIFALASSWV